MRKTPARTASKNRCPPQLLSNREQLFVGVADALSLFDCVGLDSIVGRQVGKHKLDQIPVSEALPDHPTNGGTNPQINVISVPEREWQTASKQFAMLKPLLDMDGTQRTRADVERVSKILKRYPATIYR